MDDVGLESEYDPREFGDLVTHLLGCREEGGRGSTRFGDQGVVLVGDANTVGDGLTEAVARRPEEPTGAYSGMAICVGVGGCAHVA